MAENIFHRDNSKRFAAWLALFAIALIIVAPLISVSLQKRPDECDAGYASRYVDDECSPGGIRSGSIRSCRSLRLLRPVGACAGDYSGPGAAGLYVAATAARTSPSARHSGVAFLPLALSRYPRAAAIVCFYLLTT